MLYKLTYRLQQICGCLYVSLKIIAALLLAYL